MRIRGGGSIPGGDMRHLSCGGSGYAALWPPRCEEAINSRRALVHAVPVDCDFGAARPGVGPGLGVVGVPWETRRLPERPARCPIEAAKPTPAKARSGKRCR